jgi:Zn-dependent M28 family amino/carboxypeptidase
MNMMTANQLVTTYNTIGMLYGQEEPDRYVLVGNHRDAWVLGALDPSSGTACMLEMARTFGKVKKDYGIYSLFKILLEIEKDIIIKLNKIGDREGL